MSQSLPDSNDSSSVAANGISDSDQGYWSRQPGVITRIFGEEYVLIPAQQSRVDMQKLYSLNETGAFLWEELQTKKKQSELINTLYNNFTITVEQAQQDVSSFISALAARNLIIKTA